MKIRIVVLALLVMVALYGSAGAPEVEFGSDGVSILTLKAGTKVAWMCLTRTNVGHHTMVRIDRGIEVAKPSRKADVRRAGADKARSLWVVAAVDEDIAGIAIAPGYSSSPLPIEIVAEPGTGTIGVVAPEVELMYVRPNGGAWFISATDGGRGDQDQTQNTVISISLQSLDKVQGNPHPPQAAVAGDTILMIDPRSNRMTVVKVGQ